MRNDGDIVLDEHGSAAYIPNHNLYNCQLLDLERLTHSLEWIACR